MALSIISDALHNHACMTTHAAPSAGSAQLPSAPAFSDGATCSFTAAGVTSPVWQRDGMSVFMNAVNSSE